MGVVVASAAPLPPPPAPVPWPGVAAMTWTGWDGSEFDLLDPTMSGVMLVQDGLRGLNMPAFTRYTSKAPGVAGARWRGFSTDERDVFWPTLMWSKDGTEDWLVKDSAFWRTMRPDMVGAWTISTVTGSRSLMLRFADDGDHSFPADPLRRGWSVYGIRLVAEQPYWEGSTVSYQWADGEQRPFLPGPPFYIGGSVALASATMTNDGDVDAYPVWQLFGPSTTAVLGFDGDLIEVPFDIEDGDVLTIDTRPDQQTAILSDGTDRTGDLGAVSFAPIPAGGRKELSLSMTGGGTAAASLTPLFFRAWGTTGPAEWTGEPAVPDWWVADGLGNG